MPRKPLSGTHSLMKKHHRSCRRPARLIDCDCAWRGRYKGYDVALGKWCGKHVPPRELGPARTVLDRMRTAIDETRFDPEGEQQSLGTEQSFASFIDDFAADNQIVLPTKEQAATSSRGWVLGILKASALGRRSLKELAGSSALIKRWLDDTATARQWKAKTWVNYYGELRSLFNTARTLKVGGKARIGANPMDDIEPRVFEQPQSFKQRHLNDGVEAKLFAACAQLNRVQHVPNKRAKLTQAKADEIRRALKRGETGASVAARYQVSATIVSQILKGHIWNPTHAVVGTKGTEMQRRLIGAFDIGLRRGEMMGVNLVEHVSKTLVTARRPDGKLVKAYVITLPPALTKGGKTTGEPEEAFAGTPRARRMIEARRFQLRGKPTDQQFLFGTEDGRYQAAFRRLWPELFTRAGLDYGRDKGLVWHTVRHEYISRVVENEGDPLVAQQLARHKDLETTRGYMHTHRHRLLSAAVGLHRGAGRH